MKAKPETRFYDEYELSRPAKAAVEATRARLLQGLGEAVQASDQPIVQAVRIHILTPVLRSQQDRKLGRMRMAEPSRKSPMQAMPVSGRSSQAQTQTQAQTQAQAQAQSQSQGAKPRDRAGSRNAQSTPQLARLTISQRKMERNAHLTGVQLAAKQEEGAKSMKVASLEVYKADRERKLSQTTKQTEREIKRQRMRDALKYIIDLAVRRRNALRTALPASPLLQVPETRKRPRKRMPESTFAAQAGSSGAVVSNDTALTATFNAPLAKGRASSYLDPSIPLPLPCPPPAALVEPAKEGEEDKRAAIKNGKKETEEDDKEMGYKVPTALQKPGYLKLNHANSEDRGEPLPQIVIPQAGAEVQPTKVSNHEEGKEHSLSPLKRPNLLSPNDPRKRPRRNTASVESNADFARSMEQLALSRLYK
jgi:hypothetical protein